MADSAKAPDLVIGYHRIRGLGAPLRMLAHFRQADHQIIAYGEDMKEKWFGEGKPEVAAQNACANLPYLIDNNGSDYITQTNTCLVYMGQKLGSDSKPAEDLKAFTRNHTVLDQSMDLRNDLMTVVYDFSGACNSKEEFFGGKAKDHLEKSVKGHLTKLEAFLAQQGNAGPYFCGEKPQSGDFACWELLDQHQDIAKAIGLSDDFLADNNFTNLRKLWASLRQEPTLQKYFESEQYTTWFQNNGLFTFFSGQPEGAAYGPSEQFSVRF